MADEDTHRKRAGALLTAAAESDNMKLRGELIDQAGYWHNLAMDAHMTAEQPAANNDDQDADEQRQAEG